jgi:hypothetical protein
MPTIAGLHNMEFAALDWRLRSIPRSLWLTLLAFLRITTNSKASKRPFNNDEACELVSGWIARPNVGLIEAGERFWEVLRAQIVEAQVSGPLVSLKFPQGTR